VGINWDEFPSNLKKLRENARVTQDTLAAKVGVWLPTIGLLETGRRRPSLDLLEKLAAALGCRVRDLIPETEKEDNMRISSVERDPSLRGVPNFFRAIVGEANDLNNPADYSHAGYQMAHRSEDYITDKAHDELVDLWNETHRSDEGDEDLVFAMRLEEFFLDEFPGCMELVPPNKREEFFQGVSRAVEEGRFPPE